MTAKDDDVQESTRVKLQELTESAVYKLAIPAIMSCAIFFLGWTVNRLSDHFDRIDAHLAASDTSTVVLRHDVDEEQRAIPQLDARIKDLEHATAQTAWTVQEIQRDQGTRKR